MAIITFERDAFEKFKDAFGVGAEGAPEELDDVIAEVRYAIEMAEVAVDVREAPISVELDAEQAEAALNCFQVGGEGADSISEDDYSAIQDLLSGTTPPAPAI